MDAAHDDDPMAHRRPDREPAAPTAAPVLIALVVVVALGGLAFTFLRPDDDGELLRPARLAAVDDDTVRADLSGRSPCERIERAQVDFDDDRVFVELVATTLPRCVETGDGIDVTVEIDVPEEIGDRRLVAGVGRTRLPCTTRDGAAGAMVSCAPEP